MDKKKSVVYRIGWTIGSLLCIFALTLMTMFAIVGIRYVAEPIMCFISLYKIEFAIGLIAAVVIFLVGRIYEPK